MIFILVSIMIESHFVEPASPKYLQWCITGFSKRIHPQGIDPTYIDPEILEYEFNKDSVQHNIIFHRINHRAYSFRERFWESPIYSKLNTYMPLMQGCFFLDPAGRIIEVRGKFYWNTFIIALFFMYGFVNSHGWKSGLSVPALFLISYALQCKRYEKVAEFLARASWTKTENQQLSLR